jgi:hypothetical protein
MPMLRRNCVVLLVVLASACGGNKSTPTSPSGSTPTTFSLSGQVTDSTTSAGIPGATVSIADSTNAGKSATTDASGNYSVAALQQAGFTVNVTANGYVSSSKGVTLTSNQTLAFPLTPVPTTPTPAGIRFDNISIPHQFIVGSPIPTQDVTRTYCCWPPPVRNAGTFTFNLADFPLNILPSGGTSNVISESEMVLVGLATSATGPMTFQWHKAVGRDTVIYTYSGAATYNWNVSYVGHFSWEIIEPGRYYLVVNTPWGDAELDFLVSSSSLTKHELRNDAVLFASEKLGNANTRLVLGQGGGGRGALDVAEMSRLARLNYFPVKK